MLSPQGDVALHRQVFILAGDESWQKKVLKEILLGHENDSLWVGDEEVAEFPFVPVKKAQSWLGNEKKIVIFDANKDFDPDSFAAISGIVVGGGLFFLLLPDRKMWNKAYSLPFGQRMIKSINSTPELIIINEYDEKINFHIDKLKTNIKQNCASPFLTLDQQRAVETVEEQVLNDNKIPIVLISDRGRGKSAALGLSAARLLKVGIKNVAIAAPRLRATDVVFKHIVEILPEAEVTRGCVKYGERVIQFYSPDQLMQENINTNLLLVDEAAAIPVPLLTSFLHKYSQCVFATTVHGYEGTGRGFALRFFNVLDKYNSNWFKLHLQTPIRWLENDPLEKWMFSLLCLDAELIDVSSADKINESNVEHCLLTKRELVDNTGLLGEVFSLLVLAHYRTRPKDLKSLLNDEEISLYVTLKNKHVIAAALVIREGLFSASLSTSVYRGERRPSGHLLAQALTYHCGVEHAATLDYARVMRIAVHSKLQGLGVGTKLLQFIISSEQNKGRDAIGCSYGMNIELLNFWESAGFSLMRIGFTREQTSGEHAAIMMKALTQSGEEIHHQACERFIGQLPFWFDDVLKDLPGELKNNILTEKIKSERKLTEYDKKDLQSFVNYSRNYELCIAALSKLVFSEQKLINNSAFSKKLKIILNEKVLNKKGWKQISININLTGKSEARKLFYQAIIQVLETSNNDYSVQ